MFYDGDWRRSRYETQHRRYKAWRRTVQDRRLAVIELGAGTTIATVRRECEYIAWKLIRINPHDTERPARGVLLPVGALEALTALDAATAVAK
jgi:hypothetical protein